jgi:hypothetical protein
VSGKEARLVQIAWCVAAACALEAEREGKGTDAGDAGDIEEERNAAAERAEGRVQPVVELEHVDEEDGGEGEGARSLEL